MRSSPSCGGADISILTIEETWRGESVGRRFSERWATFFGASVGEYFRRKGKESTRFAFVIDEANFQ